MHIFEISSRKRKIPFDLLIFSVQEKQKKQRWKKKHPTAPQPARDAKSIPQKRHTHTIITKKHAWRNLRRLLQFHMEIIWDRQTTGAKFLSKIRILENHLVKKKDREKNRRERKRKRRETGWTFGSTFSPCFNYMTATSQFALSVITYPMWNTHPMCIGRSLSYTTSTERLERSSARKEEDTHIATSPFCT